MTENSETLGTQDGLGELFPAEIGVCTSTLAGAA